MNFVLARITLIFGLVALLAVALPAPRAAAVEQHTLTIEGTGNADAYVVSIGNWGVPDYRIECVIKDGVALPDGTKFLEGQFDTKLSICSITLDKGETILLKGGFNFASLYRDKSTNAEWIGCDVVSNDGCEQTLQGDETVQYGGELIDAPASVEVTRGGKPIDNNVDDDIGIYNPDGTEYDVEYTVTNTGTNSLSFTEILSTFKVNTTVDYLDGDNKKLQVVAAFVLNGGESRTFSPAFTPLSDGPFSFGIKISFDGAHQGDYIFRAVGNTGLPKTLTVQGSGDGAGTVVGALTSDNTAGTHTCAYDSTATPENSGDCDEEAAEGTEITLTATAETGSVFTGWTNCSGGGDVVVDNTCKKTVTSTDETVTAEFALGVDVDINVRTSRIIQNFMSRRADQLTANDPDLTGRLTSRGQGDLADGSFALTSDSNTSRVNVSAATSLLRLMRQTQSSQSEAGQSEAGQSAALPGTDYGLVGASVTSGPEGSVMPQTPLPLKSPFGVDIPNYDIWLKTSFVRMEGDSSNDGSLGLLFVGADYLINDHTVLGFLTQLDWMEEEDKSENYSVEGLGWMAGPYVVTRLFDEVIFDGRVAWGQSYNSIMPDGTYEDEFDTERWMVRGQLTGRYQVGEFTVSPQVRALYFEEQQQSYIDSENKLVPDQTVSLGRLVFGPTVSYSHQASGGMIVEPSLTVQGLWDFDPADLVDIDSGDSYASTEDLRARIEIGMRMSSMGAGYNFNLSAFYDGIGVDEVESYGGSVSVRIPLN